MKLAIKRIGGLWYCRIRGQWVPAGLTHRQAILKAANYAHGLAIAAFNRRKCRNEEVFILDANREYQVGSRARDLQRGLM